MKNFYFLSIGILLFAVQGTIAQNNIPVNSLNIGSPANRAGTIYVNNVDASGNLKIGGNLDVAGVSTLNKVRINSAILNSLQVRQLQISGGTVAAGNVLTADANGFGTWQSPSSGFWSLTGNAGTIDGTNFIGTTDNIAFNIKVNGQPSGRIDPISENTFLGYQAGLSNTTGYVNTSIGANSFQSNTTGVYNTVVGWHAFSENVSGSGNTAIGEDALIKITTGSNLTAVGRQTFAYYEGLTNSSAFGFAASITASNQIVLGNTDITSIGGQVGWTSFSDGRYKRNIKQNVPGLAFINQLQPITYTVDVSAINSKLQSSRGDTKENDAKYSSKQTTDLNSVNESSNIIHTGFIAQDVEKSAQKLGYNFSGVDRPKDDSKSFYGLRYGEFVVPLVKAVQELSSRNDSLAVVITQLQDSLNAVVEQMNNRLSRLEQSAGMSSNRQNPVSALLSSAKLYQNAPNPFSQHTLISYFIPDNTGSATIQITDMSGTIVKSVPVNAKGNGQLTLSTAQMNAGIYNCSLYVDGSLIDSKKMVLVK